MSLRFQKDGGAKSKQSWTNLSHWNTGGSSNRYEELLGSLNNHDNDAGYNAKKKMNLYFMNENSQLSRSFRFVNGSKNVLELNVQWWRVIPNGNTKY